MALIQCGGGLGDVAQWCTQGFLGFSQAVTGVRLVSQNLLGLYNNVFVQQLYLGGEVGYTPPVVLWTNHNCCLSNAY